jgi:hypothetical protein
MGGGQNFPMVTNFSECDGIAVWDLMVRLDPENSLTIWIDTCRAVSPLPARPATTQYF